MPSHNAFKYRLGIDLGGTKAEAAILGPEGEIIAKKRIPTPKDSYQTLINHLVSLVRDLETSIASPATVGIGIPGFPCNQSGEIKGANLAILNGKPFSEDLAKELDRPVRVENDANCFTLSEAIDGAAKGHGFVFGIILGTGCGGGLVFNNTIWPGKNLCAGEWGHNPLPYPKADEPPYDCPCGKKGCIEQFLAGPGFERTYRSLGGEAIGAAEIAERAAAGETLAATCLSRYQDQLARAMSTIINFLDPDCIVLGGGVSNIPNLLDPFPHILYPYAVSQELTTVITKARYGDASGVRGAAWL